MSHHPTRRRLTVLLPAVAAAALGTLVLSRAGAQAPAPADKPAPAATTAATGKPADSAAPKDSAAPAESAAPVERPVLPAGEEKAIDFEPIPAAEDKPKAPKSADWKAATPVKLTQRGPRAKSCKAYRLREWVKVHCDRPTTAVALMGGTTNGAYFWLPQAREGERAPAWAEVIFPLKTGDRRVFELFSFGPAYGGSMISPGLVLQEHWIEGEPAPVIILR